MGTCLAWWFAARGADGEVRLPNGDGRVVRLGETLTDPVDRYGNRGPLVMCERGFHASPRALDALRYAPGPILYRVRLSGEVLESDDKGCASERTALAMCDATRLLRRWGAGAARDALVAERARGREPDPRSWAAVEVALRHADGHATDEELSAAERAARSAAAGAAGAAWSAAWSAASAAAGAASAAWSAAWNAASAAWSAAWSAASAAESATSEHADSLERLCLAAIGESP